MVDFSFTGPWYSTAVALAGAVAGATGLLVASKARVQRTQALRDRAQAEEAQARALDSVRKYRHVYYSVPVALISADSEGSILRWNDAASRLFSAALVAGRINRLERVLGSGVVHSLLRDVHASGRAEFDLHLSRTPDGGADPVAMMYRVIGVVGAGAIELSLVALPPAPVDAGDPGDRVLAARGASVGTGLLIDAIADVSAEPCGIAAGAGPAVERGSSVAGDERRSAGAVAAGAVDWYAVGGAATDERAAHGGVADGSVADRMAVAGRAVTDRAVTGGAADRSAAADAAMNVDSPDGGMADGDDAAHGRWAVRDAAQRSSGLDDGAVRAARGTSGGAHREAWPGVGALRLHALPVHWFAEGASLEAIEILLRIDDGDGRLQRPAAALKQAEAGRGMATLDLAVLAKLASALRNRPAGQPAPMKIFVNVGRGSVVSEGFVARLDDLLSRDPDLAGRVVFEVPQSALLADPPAARRFVHELDVRGLEVTVDDFGAGVSPAAALSGLVGLPVRYLKLAPDLTAGLGRSLADRSSLRALVLQARAAGRLCIAKHVEDARALAVLAGLGCVAAQGHLIGSAQPVEHWLGPMPETSRILDEAVERTHPAQSAAAVTSCVHHD